MGMYPNAYYNYRKHRRAKEAARKQTILRQIQAIYHETNGVAGCRRMQIHLARKGIHLSALTVHKYMNTELGLHSIVRRKAPRYQGDPPHKKFENLLKQDFTATQINQNGRRISPIYFSVEVMFDIIVRSLTCMIAASLQA